MRLVKGPVGVALRLKDVEGLELAERGGLAKREGLGEREGLGLLSQYRLLSQN